MSTVVRCYYHHLAVLSSTVYGVCSASEGSKDLHQWCLASPPGSIPLVGRALAWILKDCQRKDNPVPDSWRLPTMWRLNKHLSTSTVDKNMKVKNNKNNSVNTYKQCLVMRVLVKGVLEKLFQKDHWSGSWWV